MAALRDIKTKIDAVKKTAQITRAMNMVAAAKLRVAQQNMETFHPYAEKFKEVMTSLSAGVEVDESFELMTPREEVQKIELVLLTADKGLCGSFNNNLIVAAEKFIKSKQAEGIAVSIDGIGRKGADYFKRRDYDVRAKRTGVLDKPNYDDASIIGREIIDLFDSHECDEVYVLYSHFYTMARMEPTLVKLLPIAPESVEGEEAAQVEYLFEPSIDELLNDLLPNYVHIQLLESFYQTSVSEHSARMAAMDNATSNCKELVKDLTLTYNKARQASITAELMDIVGGVEALKG